VVGTSLGLSYAEGTAGRQMFHATLMEPGAYHHFVQTGTFREGTMLALVLQGVGTDAPAGATGAVRDGRASGRDGGQGQQPADRRDERGFATPSPRAGVTVNPRLTHG
jgi:hypothetical protein